MSKNISILSDQDINITMVGMDPHFWTLIITIEFKNSPFQRADYWIHLKKNFNAVFFFSFFFNHRIASFFRLIGFFNLFAIARWAHKSSWCLEEVQQWFIWDCWISTLSNLIFLKLKIGMTVGWGPPGPKCFQCHKNLPSVAKFIS